MMNSVFEKHQIILITLQWWFPEIVTDMGLISDGFLVVPLQPQPVQPGRSHHFSGKYAKSFRHHSQHPPVTTGFQKFSFWANILGTESTGRGEPSFSIVIWMVFSRRCTFRLDKGILRGCNHPFVLFLTEHLPLCQLLPTTQRCNGDWNPHIENYSF